jgi:Holliday junction resolvase RusA-like endonuclease
MKLKLKSSMTFYRQEEVSFLTGARFILELSRPSLGMTEFKTTFGFHALIAGKNIKRMPDKYSLELTINDLPQRINQAPGAHWTARYAESKKWLRLVTTAMIAFKINPPKEPLRRAELKLVRYSSRCPDYDGLVQSFKPVIDALKKTKIIFDDNMKVIGAPEYEWVEAPRGKGKIEIIVREILHDEVH